jgi:peptidoglycan/LPS O-acetylase OafA/YrhL
MRSFGRRMEECGGVGPGFDFVRIALAFGVMAWHTLAVVAGRTEAGFALDIWMAVYAILPMFFALSGFLVTGSALRLPLREYILNRGFRIVPALAVDIGLSALVLGPLFTTYALADYFTDGRFFQYFLNIVGRIQYVLPGVFESNPYAGVVNGSLWTVPWEIGCYVVMSLMVWFRLIRHAWVAALVAFGWLLASAVYGALDPVTGNAFLDKLLNFVLVYAGALLIPYFLLGSAFYLWRDRIPFDGRVALLFLAGLGVASVLLDGVVWSKQPVVGLLTAVPCVYLVIYAGLSDLPKLPLFDRGDYSYGVYLYHFPILQALQQLFGFSAWYGLMIAAIVPVTLMAMFSWHTIEKPLLRFRKKFSLVGQRIAAEEAR